MQTQTDSAQAWRLVMRAAAAATHSCCSTECIRHTLSTRADSRLSQIVVASSQTLVPQCCMHSPYERTHLTRGPLLMPKGAESGSAVFRWNGGCGGAKKEWQM